MLSTCNLLFCLLLFGALPPVWLLGCAGCARPRSLISLFHQVSESFCRAQLVENPVDAAVFLPQLLPDLEKVSKDVSDPECRSVCERARETLQRIGGSGLAKKEAEQADLTQVKSSLLSILASDAYEVDDTVVAYIAVLAVHLINAKQFDKADWVTVSSYHIRSILLEVLVCFAIKCGFW